MAVILNESGKVFKLLFQGTEYQIPHDEPVDIPDIVARLYFAYGIDPLTTDHIHWCCERFRYANPQYGTFGDQQIWDEILNKVSVGTVALKKHSRRRERE